MALITVSATKKSPESKVGVTFARIREDGTNKVILKDISNTSIFAGTAAQPGYELVKWNGTAINNDMSMDDILGLVKASEGDITMLVRQRFGETVTATVEKTSNDMKTGIVLKGVPNKVYIKEFIDMSPFHGKLPEGEDYSLTMINDVNVKSMSPNEIVQVIGDVPKGPLTVTVEKNPPEVVTTTVGGPPPPGVPAGGHWGQIKYMGNTTGMMACIGCLCFGLPGLLVLCCPCDEKDVYRVNGKLYLADGRPAGEPADKFIPQGPRNQSMAR
eukprot:scaffold5860_cov223-Amphora_coffeaeformis.AAC.5